jgi:hypothetical protein
MCSGSGSIILFRFLHIKALRARLRERAERKKREQQTERKQH